jgi:hypothetical protein
VLVFLRTEQGSELQHHQRLYGTPVTQRLRKSLRP